MERLDVYTKPHCVQCDATERTLGRMGLIGGVHYGVHNLAQDQEALDYLLGKNIAAAPALAVSKLASNIEDIKDAPNIKESQQEVSELFSGFRPDHLKRVGELIIIQAAFAQEELGIEPSILLTLTRPAHQLPAAD